MAHELDFSTGRPAIAYTGKLPWHHLGRRLRPGSPIETWLEAARLNYEVLSRPVTTTDLDGNVIELPNDRALLRSDTFQRLGMVSKDFHLKGCQPRDILEFYRDLVEDIGFEIETAGALQDGKRVWAMARVGMDFFIPGAQQDIMEMYMLLTTGYDIGQATWAFFTSKRVVCMNTLRMAIKEGERQIWPIVRVPHTKSFDHNQVKAQLGLNNLSVNVDQFRLSIGQLAQTPISKKQAIEFFMDVMGYEKDEDPTKVSTITSLLSIYDNAPGQQLRTTKDTAWGLVNAVTYFTDHERRARNADSRLNSAWFGASAKLKEQAWAQALALAA